MISFPPFLSNSLLFLILIIISVKDIKEGIIPDIFVIILAFLGIFHFGISHAISALVGGGLAYSLYKIYPLLRKREGLGGGDVKMMGASGFWLDPFQIPLFLIIGGGVGIGIALLWRFLKKGPRFPLGPALALALGICIVGDHGLSKGENKMSMTFSGPSLPPASGKNPDSIVVLIHGYGGSGENLLMLGKALAREFPNTLFVAPNGPAMCEINPLGKQWFSLMGWTPPQSGTKDQTAKMLREVHTLTPSFNEYLDELLKTYNLPPEKLALVGFSQGAMFALHIALHRPACAGVVAYSGTFLEDPTKVIAAHPPVLLIHGTEDPLLPPLYSQKAEESLKALHVPVTLSLLPGVEHEIEERGLEMGATFLKNHLYEIVQPNVWGQVKESRN